ncbi:D-glycero-alpha-D-manno-heptose-1,7-bisphosphate 7-phosphatase [Pseudogracilibacillus sp. SO30301A]|uniref:D-glycero-alpha-D-manno-heptose-1,7-bisphosphate 7-phosphatase n=1 Tax=Pseudogracilibacillus sp. SO30301A TaxID=3098291 RepID=UPI00300E5859
MDKAIFLDRDGVINEVLSYRVKFVNKPKDFYLLDGAGEAIKKLNNLNYKVFVVTNQGGIGLGFMKETSLKNIHKKMRQDLSVYGAEIDDIAYCPHQPNEGCKCRKPKPKMILNLAQKHKIDLAKSYMVGDRAPDIEAGKEAGVKTVLVGTRKEQANADLQFRDLLDFSSWLEQNHGDVFN